MTPAAAQYAKAAAANGEYGSHAPMAITINVPITSGKLGQL